MSQNLTIRFPDLVERDVSARQRLEEQFAILKKRAQLTKEEKAEKERIKTVRKRLKAASKSEIADPLFVAVRDIFNSAAGVFAKQMANHNDGVLKLATGHQIDFNDVTKISLVVGLLAADGAAAPRVVLRTQAQAKAAAAAAAAKPLAGKKAGGQKAAGKQAGPTYQIISDVDDPVYGDFSKQLYAAVGEANAAADKGFAPTVLSRLEEEGDPDGRGGLTGQVKTSEFAVVVRRLRAKGLRDTTKPMQLRRSINELLDEIQLVGAAQPLAKQNIAVPLFAQETMATDIQAENIRLCAVPICVTMLETLKVFDVVDKLVEMAQDGTLNTTRGEAAELLYRYWKDTAVRINEPERRKFVAQCIGVPGGDVRGPVNRECNELWTRFVASVSELVRQQTADNLLRNNLASGVRQQQVRKAARDLARNLSAHTYGMSHLLAIELQGQIDMFVKILNHPEIKGLFGAKDMWQVVDHVATLELGGARDSSRYVTLAQSGAIITAWLAKNVRKYNTVTSLPVIDLQSVLSSDPPTSGDAATKDPTDYDLVNACELWSTDMAYSDVKLEELAQPQESPASTSRPVPIPSAARELIEQADLAGLGVGMGNGSGMGLGLARR